MIKALSEIGEIRRVPTHLDTKISIEFVSIKRHQTFWYSSTTLFTTARSFWTIAPQLTIRPIFSQTLPFLGLTQLFGKIYYSRSSRIPSPFSSTTLSFGTVPYNQSTPFRGRFCPLRVLMHGFLCLHPVWMYSTTAEDTVTRCLRTHFHKFFLNQRTRSSDLPGSM